MRFRSLTVVIVATLMTGLVFGTCFAQQVMITFWHHEAPVHRVKAFQDIINLFEKEYPSIKVKQEVVAWGDAWPKTLSAIQSGTTPDFQFDIPELNITAFQAGGIIPVDDVVKEIDGKQKFLKSQLYPYYHDGHYWGVPVWTMPMVLLYRPGYLQKYAGVAKPPATWEEVKDLAAKLTVDTDKDGVVDVYGMGLGAGNNLMTQEQVWTVLCTYGSEVYDKNGKVTFYSPATVRGLEMYRDLFKYSPPGATGWAWGEIELNFAAGKIAMMPYFGGLQKRFYDGGNFDLAGVPMPMPKTGGVRATLTYPNAVMIFKEAEKRNHVDAIRKFLAFLMRPEVNVILTATQEPGSFVPLTESSTKFAGYWSDKVVDTFEELNKSLVDAIEYGSLYGFEHGKAVNLGIGAVSGVNLFAETIQRVIVQGESPDAAARWAQAEIEKLSQ